MSLGLFTLLSLCLQRMSEIVALMSLKRPHNLVRPLFWSHNTHRDVVFQSVDGPSYCGIARKTTILL